MLTYEWNFGDGSFGVGRDVSHTYWLPGKYTWTLKISSPNSICGNYAFYTGTIYVYDWAYGIEDGLNVSYTNRCLRYSMKPSNGFGWSLFGGDDWPFPEARVGTLKILDAYDEERLLVLDAKNCNIYEIAVRDLFTDATTDYGGSEIPTEILFREERGSAEHYFQKSLEHHAEFRPYNENNQGATGYTPAGYRTAFKVDYILRRDGTQTVDTLKSVDVPIEGDITFKHDEEAHRWQPVIRTTASEFRLVKIRNYYDRLDKPAIPANRMMSEHDYCLELMGSSVNLDRQPQASVVYASSGGHDPLINFATGNEFTGMYSGFGTGPDGKSYSAVNFLAALDGATTPETVALSGDFTVMFWAKDCFDADIVAQNTGFTIDISATDLSYSEAGGPNTSLPIDWDLNEWHLYTIIRANGLLRIYVDKTLKRSIDWVPVAFSGIINVMNMSDGSVFAVRVFPAAISVGAIEFHYDDVTLKSGRATCRLF